MRHIALLVVLLAVSPRATALAQEFVTVDDFARADSLYHGSDWETLNPGYWKIENGALRRRLTNVGRPKRLKVMRPLPPTRYDPLDTTAACRIASRGAAVR